MVPWAYVLDDLSATLQKVKEEAAPHYDPVSMREITAMADYNLARSKNLFGSLQNAFDQRRDASRKVPMHMMPDFMTWLKYAQPDVHYHLYGPDETPPPNMRVQARARDTRSLKDRRANKVVVAERVQSYAESPQHVQPPEHSYRVQAGGLHERRQHQIQPGTQTSARSDAAKYIARKAAEAAEKRRRNAS
jgi:hypothetical protein